MGDAGANTDRWAEFYGVGGVPAAEATVVTAAAAATVSTSPTSGAGSPTPPQTGIEGGRVGKPARRRSRASRRAPVTLLNTDTSNFRAMVQQFTGIPTSGPYGPAGGPVISFRTGEYDGASSSLPVMRPSPAAAVMSFDQQQLAGAASSHQHQHQHQQPPTSSLQGQLFRPQPQHHHQQQQQYGYDGGDMSSFMQHGFDSSSSAEDRLLLQSIQAAQMMPSRPASTHNTNGYNFG